MARTDKLSASTDSVARQLNQARKIFDRGWTPMPVHFRSKKPVGTAWQKMERGATKLKKQFGKEPRNIGFLTGPAHGGLIDVDIDGSDVNAVIAHFLPNTTCQFGRKGQPVSHYLYRSGLEKTRRFQDPLASKDHRSVLVEVRSAGCFTLAPGSIHENGDRVVWADDGQPHQVDDEALTQAVAIGAACALLARHFPAIGQRHDAMLALTGFLIQKGWDADMVVEFAGLIADHGGFADFSLSAMVSGAADKFGVEPLPGFPRLKEYWPSEVVDRFGDWLSFGKASGHGVSDSSLAFGFVDVHREIVRYVADRRKWLHHDGKVWKFDDQGAVKSLVRSFLDRVTAADDPATSSNHKINAVLELASIDQRIVIKSDAIDNDPNLLGTPDGVVDLRTGEFLSDRPEVIITKSTVVAPDFAAKCPIWFRFLEDITGGKRRIRRFLHRWAGYCATGRTDEQVFLILFGEGQNGKSVYQKAIGNALGTYACVPSDSLFVAGARDPLPIDVSHIEASRLIQASEPEPGRKWNESMLKKVTGGDKVYSRRHYAEGKEVPATGKLLVTANNLPAPKTLDFAMRRRFLILEIDFKASEEEKDGELDERLKDEYPAILAWIIRGAVSWYRMKLMPPKEVCHAVDDYFDAHDWPGKWIAECTRRSSKTFTANFAILKSFNAFMRREGQDEWTSQALGGVFKKKGYKSGDKRVAVPGRSEPNKVRGYFGFRIT